MTGCYMKKLGLSTLILLFITACSNREPKSIEYQEFGYTLVDSIAEFPDSSFFSSISQMQYSPDGSLIILDRNRGDISRLSTDFKTFQVIMPHSETSLVNPESFYMKDGYLYVVDNLKVNNLMVIKDGTIVHAKHLDLISQGHRMTAEDNHLYMTLSTDSTSILTVSADNLQEEKRSGRVIEGPDGKTERMNKRHLLSDGSYLYAVTECFPYIEKYDLKTGELIDSADLSGIPVIAGNIEYISTLELGPKTVSLYLNDAYISQGIMYILCASRGEQYESNTVILINTDSMQPLGQIKLPSRFYDSICADNDYLYAMATSPNAELQKIKIER